MNNIKNIIFDMGGVLIPLHGDRCIAAFERLGAFRTADYVRTFRTEDLFHEIEVGTITTAEFCQKVRDLDGISASDEDIVSAWNALLSPTPAAKRDALRQLKCEGYRLFLLSNTNEMHWMKSSTELIPADGESISDYFEQCFLSHEMGVRKPDATIFERVTDALGVNPADTLFIDDNADNVGAAATLGIHTFHDTSDHCWTEHIAHKG